MSGYQSLRGSESTSKLATGGTCTYEVRLFDAFVRIENVHVTFAVNVLVTICVKIKRSQ